MQYLSNSLKLSLPFTMLFASVVLADPASIEGAAYEQMQRHLEAQKAQQAYLMNQRVLGLTERINRGDKLAIYELAELYASSPLKAHQDIAGQFYSQAQSSGVTKQALTTHPHRSGNGRQEQDDEY